MQSTLSPRWSILTLAAAALLGAAAPARATVMVEVPLEDLVRDADAIVLGTVTAVDVQMVVRGQEVEPQTVARVRVDGWLKGRGGQELRVREIGGEHRAGGTWIVGTPRYRPGEEVLLFLVEHPERPGEYRTYGMAQGKLVVRRGVPGVPDLVQRDLEGMAFARWTDGAMTVEHGHAGPAMQLRELLDLIGRVRDEPGAQPGVLEGGAR